MDIRRLDFVIFTLCSIILYLLSNGHNFSSCQHLEMGKSDTLHSRVIHHRLIKRSHKSTTNSSSGCQDSGAVPTARRHQTARAKLHNDNTNNCRSRTSRGQTEPKNVTLDTMVRSSSISQSIGGSDSGGSMKTSNQLAQQNPKASSLPTLDHRFYNNRGKIEREVVENYPEEEINRMLSAAPELVKRMFKFQDNEAMTERALNKVTSERQGYEGDGDSYTREGSICRSQILVKVPRAANSGGAHLYIANVHGLEQRVETEVCLDTEQECDYMRDCMPIGYYSACIQKYSFRDLLHYNSEERKFEIRPYYYPSSCACVVRTRSSEEYRTLKPLEPVTREAPNSTIPMSHDEPGKKMLAPELDAEIQEARRKPTTDKEISSNQTTNQPSRREAKSLNHTTRATKRPVINNHQIGAEKNAGQRTKEEEMSHTQTVVVSSEDTVFKSLDN